MRFNVQVQSHERYKQCVSYWRKTDTQITRDRKRAAKRPCRASSDTNHSSPETDRACNEYDHSVENNLECNNSSIVQIEQFDSDTSLPTIHAEMEPLSTINELDSFSDSASEALELPVTSIMKTPDILEVIEPEICHTESDSESEDDLLNAMAAFSRKLDACSLPIIPPTQFSNFEKSLQLCKEYLPPKIDTPSDVT